MQHTEKCLLAMPGQAVRSVTPLPSSSVTLCLLAIRPSSFDVPYVKMSFFMPEPLHNRHSLSSLQEQSKAMDCPLDTA